MTDFPKINATIYNLEREAKITFSKTQIGAFEKVLSAAAIPKAGTTEYQLENMDVFDWSLTAAEMAELAVLAHPVPGGRAQETPSMMCIDDDAGRMARCEYLD